MVPPSNPRLMTRVLDAVTQLCDGKGSSAREILDFIRQASKTSPRNLTMQVHRALKHAVNAGLLRHRSGRYKALFTLNPVPTNRDESQTNGDKIVDEEIDVSIEKQADNTDSVQRTQDLRMKRSKKQNNRRRRRASSQEKKRSQRRRSQTKSAGPTERIEKTRHRNPPRFKGKKENFGESHAYRRYDVTKSKISRSKRNISPALSNRRKRKTMARDRAYCTDSSDDSDYEMKRDEMSACYEQCDRYDVGRNSKARSRSRSRGLQQENPSTSEQQLRLQTKHSSETVGERRDALDNPELLNQANEKNQESNNSGSGSTL